MPRISIIALLVTLLNHSCTVNNQILTGSKIKATSINDTINYLQKNIIDKKSRFANNSFELLISNLRLVPKSYMLASNVINKNQIQSIYLRFYSFNEAMLRSSARTPNPYLFVTFKSPFDYNEFISFRGNTLNNWSEKEEPYFSKKTIKNVELFY